MLIIIIIINCIRSDINIPILLRMTSFLIMTCLIAYVIYIMVYVPPLYPSFYAIEWTSVEHAQVSI